MPGLSDLEILSRMFHSPIVLLLSPLPASLCWTENIPGSVGLSKTGHGVGPPVGLDFLRHVPLIRSTLREKENSGVACVACCSRNGWPVARLE